MDFVQKKNSCSRMVLTEEVKIEEKFQGDNLEWNDLQWRSLLVKSYPKFPRLFGIFGGFVYENLKWYLNQLTNNRVSNLFIILYVPMAFESFERMNDCRKISIRNSAQKSMH